jgi:imidazolonepropionase-like amidohydrolase
LSYLTIVGARANRDALMRGFTTVRDVGGNVFALKRATGEGIIDNLSYLDDEDAIPFPEGSENRNKFVQVTKGTFNVYRLAKKLKVKTAWGTDTLFDPELAQKQGKMLVKMQRRYAPHEILKMATHDNEQLLKLSGPRDPYPGKLGVFDEGAYADLILVDGNPLENLNLVADAEKNFVVIMKDGKIYKNTLGR